MNVGVTSSQRARGAALVVLVAATGALAYAGSSRADGVAGTCSQYAVAPTVSGLSPSSGPVGTKVAITGDHFTGNNRIASVRFGGSMGGTFKLRSKTRLTVRVPAGAKTGGITIANCAGQATTATFTVTDCLVPKVVGKTLPVAEHAITKALCKTGTVKKVHSTKKKNTVLAESPKAGKHLPVHAKVSLTVSKGT